MNEKTIYVDNEVTAYLANGLHAAFGNYTRAAEKMQRQANDLVGDLNKGFPQHSVYGQTHTDLIAAAAKFETAHEAARAALNKEEMLAAFTPNGGAVGAVYYTVRKA